MKFNWNTEANRKRIETVKQAGQVAIALAFTAAELLLAFKHLENSSAYDSSTDDCTYADVIEAIMDSSMLSTLKEAAAKAVAFNAEPELYQAAITIVDSNMLSATKVRMIETMFNHE